MLDFLSLALLMRRLPISDVDARTRTGAVRALGYFLRLMIAATVTMTRAVDMLMAPTLGVFLFEFGAFGVGVATLAGRYRIADHLSLRGNVRVSLTVRPFVQLSFSVSATFASFVRVLMRAFIGVHKLFPYGNRRAATPWLFPAMGGGPHQFRLRWGLAWHLPFGQGFIAFPVAAIVDRILIDAARGAVQLALATGIIDIRMRKQRLLGNTLTARAVSTFNAGPTALQILFALHLGAFHFTHVKNSSM
jgi:hypothetical protein